jgi:aspartyl-tRNA(Asn)/glutamyl-tRNA(Gln) amidotransferase subunit A
MLPDVAARLLHGKDIGVDDVAEARRTRARIQGEMAALMRRFDVLCAPTSPIPAVDAETGNVRVGDAEVDGARVLGRLTRLAAFTGQPAISLPCGFTAQGLPIGLQLFGDWFGEAALLGAAHAYEQASPWSARRPSGLD